MDKDLLGLVLLFGGAAAMIIAAPPLAFLAGLALIYRKELAEFVRELRQLNINSKDD